MCGLSIVKTSLCVKFSLNGPTTSHQPRAARLHGRERLGRARHRVRVPKSARSRTSVAWRCWAQPGLEAREPVRRTVGRCGRARAAGGPPRLRRTGCHQATIGRAGTGTRRMIACRRTGRTFPLRPNARCSPTDSVQPQPWRERTR